MFWSLCYLAFRCVLQLVLLRPRSSEFNELEIVVLRHQLAVLRRQTRRPQLTATDRLLLAAASRLLPRSRWRSFLVTPTESPGLAKCQPDHGSDHFPLIVDFALASRRGRQPLLGGD